MSKRQKLQSVQANRVPTQKEREREISMGTLSEKRYKDLVVGSRRIRHSAIAFGLARKAI